jgi:hypothetical protein
VRYWYRKFYSETMVGNLTVLRPDEPILYHYDRTTSKDSVKDVPVRSIATIWNTTAKDCTAWRASTTLKAS